MFTEAIDKGHASSKATGQHQLLSLFIVKLPAGEQRVHVLDDSDVAVTEITSADGSSQKSKSATGRAIVSVVENSRIAQSHHNSLARDCQLSKSVEVARPRERIFNFSLRFRGERVTNRIPCCWIEPVE